jgi:uncharacterized protein YjbI with pentapeptide repeats
MAVSIVDDIGTVLFTDPAVGATQRTAVELAVAASVPLSNADLSGWNLSGAQIQNGIFDGANCTRVDLSSADCTSCNFSGATFVGVNMANTILDKINLTGANLYDRTFGLSKNNNGLIQLSLKQWAVFFNGNTITIANKTFTRNQWNNFTNQQILNNSNQRVLNMWLASKSVIIGLSDLIVAAGL